MFLGSGCEERADFAIRVFGSVSCVDGLFLHSKPSLHAGRAETMVDGLPRVCRYVTQESVLVSGLWRRFKL